VIAKADSVGKGWASVKQFLPDGLLLITLMAALVVVPKGMVAVILRLHVLSLLLQWLWCLWHNSARSPR